MLVPLAQTNRLRFGRMGEGEKIVVNSEVFTVSTVQSQRLTVVWKGLMCGRGEHVCRRQINPVPYYYWLLGWAVVVV